MLTRIVRSLTSQAKCDRAPIPAENESPDFPIDGGALRDGNLFHSFEEFSVPTNGEAFFNSNGIVFGENARLDIGGSFFATTANSIGFENGLEFDANNPENSLVSMSANLPLGLQFNDAPGVIQERGRR